MLNPESSLQMLGTLLLNGIRIPAKDVSVTATVLSLFHRSFVQFSWDECDFTGKRYQDQISETKPIFSKNDYASVNIGRSYTHFDKLPTVLQLTN